MLAANENWNDVVDMHLQLVLDILFCKMDKIHDIHDPTKLFFNLLALVLASSDAFILEFFIQESSFISHFNFVVKNLLNSTQSFLLN